MLRLTAIFICLTGPLFAQERLIFSIPTSFALTFEDIKPQFVIREYLRAEETLGNWTLMITQTHAPQLAGLSAQAFANQMAGGLKNGCPDGYAEQIYDGAQNGYAITLLSIGCPRSPLGPDVSESAIIKVLAGKSGVYTAQIAWRGEMGEGIDKAAIDWTVPQILCDDSDPKHACPGATPEGQ